MAEASKKLYEPSEWGKEFHTRTCPDGSPIDEMLGAGAAGPGKSLVLLCDPLQQVAVEHARCEQGHRHYHPWGTSEGKALHLRRTRPMLDETIDRAQRIFKSVDPAVHYSGAGGGGTPATTFTFSSGYKYQFAHCKDPQDWRMYMSNQFCMAQGEKIVMEDQSLKPIEQVQVGDKVMTLEGPKRVTHTHKTGVKPCVSSTILYHGEIVGKHVFPTTHPVLMHSTSQSRFVWLRDLHGTSSQDQQSGYVWQDYESLLCGRPRSPVKRVSSIGGHNDYVTFGGVHLDKRRLPTLSVPVVLHAPSLHRELARQRWSSQPHESLQSHRSLSYSDLGHQQRLSLTCEDRLQRAGVFPTGLSSTEANPAYGIADAHCCLGRPICSLEYCSSCFHLRDGILPTYPGTFQENVLQLGGVAGHSPTDWHEGYQEKIPYDTVDSESSYPHFYTGEKRFVSEDVHTGTAILEFDGWYQTYDLTVESVNHYIGQLSTISLNTWIGFDELVQFEWQQYENISRRCRSGDPVLRPMCKVRAMSNPMQMGEGKESVSVSNPQWVREYFVDPAPEGKKIIRRKLVNRKGEVSYWTRLYLPATLYDNPDKEFVKDYERRLLSSSEYIRQALLYGNWYATAGSYFGEDWNPRLHTCKSFRIPRHWPRFRSMDWGYKSPGTVLWWAMDDDGNLFCEREYNFRGKDAKEVAREIKRIEQENGLWSGGRSQVTGPADTQLWEERGDVGRSKAQEMAAIGVHWIKADKKSRRVNGIRLLNRIKDHDNGSTTPGIVFFDVCRMSIRTIPAVREDSTNPEYPADGGEDHWLDAVLYACAFASHGSQGIPPRRTVDRWEDDRRYESSLSSSKGQYGYGGF